MAEQIIYGDEDLNYTVKAKDMSPEDARGYLESSIRDGIYMHLPSERIFALDKRMKDNGLKICEDRI